MHGTDLNSVHKYIPKDVLPKEYGGTGETLQELTGKKLQCIHQNLT